MALPRIVFVYEAREKSGERYLIAARTPQEAVDDLDGETRVLGTYRIFNQRTVQKVVSLKVLKERALR